jgi:EmrB/QacA subfamily drug resistance transporter
VHNAGRIKTVLALIFPGNKESFTTSNQPRTRAALIVMTIASFIGPFMSSSVNVALPSIGKEFSMGAVSLGWINTAYLLAAATLLIPFGRMGDLYGKKRIFVIGLFLLMITSTILGSSVSGAMVIAGRVFQGIASAMLFATAMPILVSIVPPEMRGKAIGIVSGATYLGLSVGPLIGGFLTQQFGWRYVFWLYVPLALILLALTYFMLEYTEERSEKTKFDIAGSAILGASLLLTMYGFSTLPSVLAAALTAAGIIGVIMFVMYESSTEAPLFDIDLFRRNTVFAFSSLAALINYAATFAIAFTLSLYLQQLRGLSPREAGLILVAQPVMQAIFSPYAGKLSDRIQPRTLSSIGMAIDCVGLLMLAFIGQETSMVYIIVCLMILGFGFALFVSPNTNAIMSSVAKSSLGLAGATVGAVRQIGMMMSMGIVMMVLALFIGKADIAPGNYQMFVQGLRIAFAVFAVACFGGVFASLARGKMERG